MPAAVEKTIAGIDFSLTRFSPEMLKLTVQLFDVLAMGITRGPLTGVWGSWENASAAEVSAFIFFAVFFVDAVVIVFGITSASTAE